MVHGAVSSRTSNKRKEIKVSYKSCKVDTSLLCFGFEDVVLSIRVIVRFSVCDVSFA